MIFRSKNVFYFLGFLPPIFTLLMAIPIIIFMNDTKEQNGK